VLAVDAQAINGEPLVEEVWPVSRLEEMLSLSDVVVVSAPLTAETANLLSAEMIAAIRNDAYLIVVSRGGIVDEDALVDALESGALAGAGIDVTAEEPLPKESRLWDAPRLILTPHLAGASAPKERRVVEIFRENLIRFQNGDPLLNVVDKSKGY